MVLLNYRNNNNKKKMEHVSDRLQLQLDWWNFHVHS